MDCAQLRSKSELPATQLPKPASVDTKSRKSIEYPPRPWGNHLNLDPSIHSHLNLDPSIHSFGKGNRFYLPYPPAYRNTLLSFSPTLDAHDQSSDFEIFLIKDKEVTGAKMEFFKRLDSDSQKQLKELQERRFGAKAFSPKPINSDGVTVAFKAFGRSFRFPPNKRFKNEFQIRQAIEEFIKRQKEHFVTGRGVVIGTEVLQSRQVHNLLGIGNELSGKYYFTQVTHRMGKDSPYITEFACRRVIEDSIVQAPPAFNISESDERIQKFKQERVKSPKPPTITNFPGLAGISAEED